MAVSFNKEVVLEAIQEVLAEGSKTVIVGNPSQTAQDIMNDPDVDSTAKKTAVDAIKKGMKGDKVEVPTKSMEEDHHQDPNDDSNMAKSQLYAIAKYAIELLQLIKDGDQLDAWVQAKITKAADYIDAVQHYLEGEEYLDANQGESEEELAEGDYQARTKEDLVFQYLRDAWQFGALKGKDINPDEELSTMADSLLANLPDYDAADRVNEQAESLQSIGQKIEEKLKALGLQTKVFGGEFEVPKSARDMIAKNNKLGALAYSRDKSIFAGHPEYERLEVIIHKDHLEDLKKIANEFKMPSGSVQAFAGTGFVRLRHTADVVGESVELDEIKKAEFEKIKPGKELQLRGYGVVTVVANDGIVMKIKDSLDKVHTINLGQYNEKFLKEDDDVEPSKKDIKAAEKDVKNVSDDKKAQFNRALKFINKYKGNTAVVAGMIKKAKEEYKLPANLLKDLARAAQVNEGLTENKATCCGKCGRTHVKGTECKKPFLTGQDHCRVR
jgi:hypothetical protein